MPKALKFSIGDRFGKLTIIGEAIRDISSNGRRMGNKHLCKCDCGTESYYKASALNKGSSIRCKSCSIKDKTIIIVKLGDKFGDLEVIDETWIYFEDGLGENKTKRKGFKCRCKCGSEYYYRIGSLVHNYINSCKHCAYKKRPQSIIRFTNEERLYNLSIIRRCKATDGRIENNLPIEEFLEIVNKDCYYCGEPPRKLDYLNNNKIVLRGEMYANGVDRLDSKGHYDKQNCVPCCKECNTMKMQMDINEFLNKIEVIYNRWKQGVIIMEN